MIYDTKGNLYVALRDANQIGVVHPGGRLTLLAGSPSGEAGYANGPALQARFDAPSGIAVGRNGELYIADSRNHIIRVLNDGEVKTYAGTGQSGTLDGGRSQCRFLYPASVAVDHDGSIFVADGSARIRKIDSAGNVSTLAIRFNNIHGIAVGDLTLFVSDDYGLDAIFPGGRTMRYPIAYRAGSKDLYLEAFRPIGHPFSLAALDSTSLVYTDPRSKAIRYIVVGLGVGRIVAQGSAAAERAVSLAVTPDGTVAVGGRSGQIALLGGLDFSRPLAPTIGLFMGFLPAGQRVDPKDYSIGYFGNSSVWWDASRNDSIEGRMEAVLNASRAKAAFHARVLPVVMAGAGIFASIDYIATLADAGLIRMAILSIDPGLIGSAFSLPPLKVVEQRDAWDKRALDSVQHLKDELTAHGVPLIVVIQPNAFEFSASANYGRSKTDGLRPFADELTNAGTTTIDLYPVFAASPDRKALYGQTDTHLSPAGRRLVGETVARYFLERGLWPDIPSGSRPQVESMRGRRESNPHLRV